MKELIGTHSEQPVDRVADLVEPRQVLPTPIEPGETRLGVLLGGAGSPELGAQKLRTAHDPDSSPTERCFEGHLRDGTCRGVVGQQPLALPPCSGNGAVERKGNGVEHCRLPGSGLAVQQKQPVGPQRVEIDRLRSREGAEGGDLE